MDILVRKKYSPRQIKQAALKADEFKPGRYTSGSANLDDMIALNKAVILCDAHSRKFSAKAAHYRLHPDKKMRRVIGNCDVCKDYGLSWFYLNGKDAHDEEVKLEKFRSALEYGKLHT